MSTRVADCAKILEIIVTDQTFDEALLSFENPILATEFIECAVKGGVEILAAPDWEFRKLPNDRLADFARRVAREVRRIAFLN